jgi:hypothetical protein
MLEVLKYLGFVVTAASSIWGLIAKTSYEDSDGNKRLTAAGQVSIGLAIAGFLVGAGAYGVERSIAASNKAQEDIQTRLEQDRKQRFEDRQDLAIIETREWNQRFERLQSASAAADRLAERLLLSEQGAARRDILFSRQMAEVRAAGLDRRVQEGTRSNLERTGEALGQLERLLKPLERVTIRVVWEMPLHSAEAAPIAASLDRLAGDVRQRSAGVRANLPEGCTLGRGGNLEDASREAGQPSIILRPGCSAYPSASNQPELYATIRRRTHVLFDLDRSDDSSIRSGLQMWIAQTSGFNNSLAELIFDLRTPNPALHYYPRTKTLRFLVGGMDNATPELGRIVSIPDLERSSVLLMPHEDVAASAGRVVYAPAFARELRPHLLEIRAGQRTYRLHGGSFRRLPPFFVADRVGQPL